MNNKYAATASNKNGNTEVILGQMEPYYTIEQNEEPISLELIPCPTCSRTFIQQTLEKHVKICEKMTIRKRKIFDSSRQRREGTELAAYPLPKNYGLPAVKNERGISPKPIQAAPPILSPKKPPEEPIKTSTNLKCVTPITSKKPLSPSKATNNLLVTSSNLSAAPKERSRPAMITKRIQPPPAEQCPYCERCFGIKAYDRHVEWCKEKALLASIKNNSSNSQVAAKERLEARIKYKAPCLKTKRAVNRDKYSYQNDEHFDMQSSMNENHQTALMTSSMTSSCMSDILIAPKNLNPHTIKKKMPLKDSKNLTKFPKEDRVKAVKIISTDSYLRNDVKLQQLSKKDFQRDLSIDPTMLHVYKQASNKDLKSPMTKIKGKDNGSSIIAQRENLSKSKMSSSNGRDIIKESVEVVSFDSSSNRSVYQVPGRLPKNQSFIVRSTKETTENSSQKYQQEVELNLDSDENKNRVAANPSAQIEEVKIDDNKFQKIEDGETEGDAPNRVVDEESDSQLRMRRISLLNDFPNVKLNNAKNLIQQMHEDFQGLHASAAADGEEDFNCGNLHQITGRSLHPADSDEISSIEYYPVHRGGKGQSGGRNCGVIKSKQSADSAYGSLSRQSPTREINSNYHSNASYRATPISAPQDLPKTGQSTFQYPTIKPHKYKNNPDVQNYRCRNFSADSSSSGSENSLSPVNGSKHVSSVKEQQSQVQEFNLGFQRNPLSTSTLEKKHKSTKSTGSISNSSSTNNLPTPNVKTSKFCHECGSKFLLDQAKFCMDCGVRRIVMK